MDASSLETLNNKYGKPNFIEFKSGQGNLGIAEIKKRIWQIDDFAPGRPSSQIYTSRTKSRVMG